MTLYELTTRASRATQACQELATLIADGMADGISITTLDRLLADYQETRDMSRRLNLEIEAATRSL